MPLTRFYSVAQKHAYGQTDKKISIYNIRKYCTQSHANNKMLRKIEVPILIQVTFSDVLGGLFQGISHSVLS